MFTIKKVVVGVALVIGAHTASHAALAQIVMGGVNFSFFENGGGVCDAGGGVGCFGNADPLTSMSFFLGGALQGTLVAGIGLNMLLQLPALVNPTLNGTTALLNFGNEVIDAQIGGVPGLFTNVNGGSVTFSNGGTVTSASGSSTIFGAQALPFGMLATGPISWLLNGTGACTGAPGQRTCTYAGTAEMSWQTTPVPEPASAGLAGLALLALAAAARRSRAG